MKKNFRLFNLLIVVALSLSACNLPSSSSNGDGVVLTAAAQTVQAMLSATPLVATTATPSLTPPPLPATLTPAPILTNTPAATATSNCYVAQFIADVTIPDGSVMKPNEAFVKKWRVRNAGSCVWNGFSLIFDNGDSMGGPATNAIATLNPSQEIDVAVNLTAPSAIGAYRGYWRINTNSGVVVPIINGYMGKSVYVDIKVQNAPTAVPTTAVPTTAVPTVISFAITNVTFNVTGTCPNFNYTYSITTNGAGTVNLHRIFSDGGVDTTPATMTFASASTQTSANQVVYFGLAGSSSWTDIYIDSPNHQQFGRATFTCP